jgi:uncharacterized protein YkwD
MNALYSTCKKASLQLIVSVIGCFFIAGCGSSYKAAATADIANVNITKAKQTIAALVNDYRKKKGLSKLEFVEEISAIARNHSKRMGDKKVAFGHGGFDDRYTQLKKIIKRIGGAGENVAFGNIPLQQIVDGWIIKSPNHRENMEEVFKLTGVGIYRDKKGTFYYTQIFLNQTK